MSRILNGIPTSWDSCTATTKSDSGAWSPCGQLIAASSKNAIYICNPNTLEGVSTLRIPEPYHSQSITFSPDGCLLVCLCLESRDWVRYRLGGGPIPFAELDIPLHMHVIVWDVQPGVVINNIELQKHCRVAFFGNHGTIIFLETDGTFCGYNGLKGACLFEEKLTLPSDFILDAHWIHKELLQISTSSKNNGMYTVNIYEFQPTSTPPSTLVKSFPVPPHSGKFSFSSVSLHASFITGATVVIFNLQDSRILLQIEEPLSSDTPVGCFSPDGRFFTGVMKGGQICIWKNTSTNHTLWRNLWPQSKPEGFSFSPTTSSFLAWGAGGVQLLDLNSHNTPPPKLNHQQKRGSHLVAYSTDRTHIAIAQEEASVVTVFDPLSDISQWLLNTGMETQDIKIVGKTLFVVEAYEIASWCLETGEQVDEGVIAIPAPLFFPINKPHILSDDCLQIACGRGRTVLLYDIKTQGVLCEYKWPGPDGAFANFVQFSPDGNQLWLATQPHFQYEFILGKSKREEDGSFGDLTMSDISGKMAWANLFSHGWHVGEDYCWVLDPRGDKTLWLPFGWRPTQQNDVRWDGNLLAILCSDLPDPIVIEFQP